MLRLFKHKAVIIAGHFGTGKTNIAVNTAICAAKVYNNLYITDLDIVNPYFRTADNAEALQKAGIKVLLPQFANTNVDIPTIPPNINFIFSDDAYSITDVGGNEDGATVLRCFAEEYKRIGYDMYYVYNRFRPENLYKEDAVYSFKSIELSSGLKFSGIINNSNLGTETTKQIVEESVKYASEFASEVNVPLIFTTAFENNKTDNSVVISDISKKLF